MFLDYLALWVILAGFVLAIVVASALWGWLNKAMANNTIIDTDALPGADQHFGLADVWNIDCDCPICRICFPVDPGAQVRVANHLFEGKEARILALDTDKGLIEVQTTLFGLPHRVWLKSEQIEQISD
tara:strand:+ start:626 stop:1009 length:384 start_codon:yes stop_codon:yes gene_type:complete